MIFRQLVSTERGEGRPNEIKPKYENVLTRCFHEESLVLTRYNDSKLSMKESFIE
jgi:hypothetical protein